MTRGTSSPDMKAAEGCGGRGEGRAWTKRRGIEKRGGRRRAGGGGGGGGGGVEEK